MNDGQRKPLIDSNHVEEDRGITNIYGAEVENIQVRSCKLCKDRQLHLPVSPPFQRIVVLLLFISNWQTRQLSVSSKLHFTLSRNTTCQSLAFLLCHVLVICICICLCVLIHKECNGIVICIRRYAIFLVSPRIIIYFLFFSGRVCSALRIILSASRASQILTLSSLLSKNPFNDLK
jgi:hypothetical protein